MASKASTKQTVDPEYQALSDTYGKVHILNGEDGLGNPQVAYFKSPGFETKKQVMTLLGSSTNKDNALLDAAIVMLVACHIGGYDFYQDEDVRLEA
ncbi:MAG: hypothetical protein EOO60_05650, partial [Hymenobacter sp.]